MGAHPESMLNIYRRLLRSTIDYGAFFYATASRELLKILDTLQYAALREAIGVRTSTPTNALLVECGEPPLEMRRQ